MTFLDAQRKFAAHIRHPDINPAPAEVEDRRMGIYRDLFYNNIESFLANGFPVLKQITREDRWHQMVRDFMHRHQSHSPYFVDISKEFLTYLDTVREEDPEDFPFLIELAHYEWVELALEIDQAEVPVSGYNPKGDLMAGHPLVSPLVWVLQYAYPVHQISADNIPQVPSPVPVFLLAYRNREDQVKFMEINGVTARLLAILQERQLCRGEEAVKQLIEELQHPNPEVVYHGAREALQHLLDREIILGTALKTVG